MMAGALRIAPDRHGSYSVAKLLSPRCPKSARFDYNGNGAAIDDDRLVPDRVTAISTGAPGEHEVRDSRRRLSGTLTTDEG